MSVRRYDAGFALSDNLHGEYVKYSDFLKVQKEARAWKQSARVAQKWEKRRRDECSRALLRATHYSKRVRVFRDLIVFFTIFGVVFYAVN